MPFTQGDAARSRLVELLAEVAQPDGPPRIDLTHGPDGDHGRRSERNRQDDHDRQARAPHVGPAGRRTIVGAADTYRAAAIEQLETWAERSGTEIVKGQPGGDPGAVVFDAVSAAEARGADVVIIDTAGRLHTHGNLMEELAKVSGWRTSASRALRTRRSS